MAYGRKFSVNLVARWYILVDWLLVALAVVGYDVVRILADARYSVPTVRPLEGELYWSIGLLVAALVAGFLPNRLSAALGFGIPIIAVGFVKSLGFALSIIVVVWFPLTAFLGAMLLYGNFWEYQREVVDTMEPVRHRLERQVLLARIEETRFFLERSLFFSLALFAVLAVAMTILFTTQVIDMTPNERRTLAIAMATMAVFDYAAVFLLGSMPFAVCLRRLHRLLRCALRQS